VCKTAQTDSQTCKDNHTVRHPRCVYNQLDRSLYICLSDTELTNYGNLNLKYYNSKYNNEVVNQGITTTINNHYCVQT